MDTLFCIDALKEAIDNYGAPEIFNTDQGSQFTGNDFISTRREHQALDYRYPKDVYLEGGGALLAA